MLDLKKAFFYFPLDSESQELFAFEWEDLAPPHPKKTILPDWFTSGI